MIDNVKKHIGWLIPISIGVYLLAVLITTKWFPDKTIIDCIGYTGTIVTLLSVTYIQWLWRFNPLEKTPKLRKEYTGTFTSTYDNVKRTVEIKIKQNLLRAIIYLKTDESSSKSVISGLYEDCEQKWLTYVYLNTPIATVRERSEIHYGVCRLLVDDVNFLTGQYFTDRKTLGDIELKPKN